MATPRQAITANTVPNPHSVSIMDMSTPSKAIIEPTESSMPPVIMTSPKPILKIPKAPICLARFCRLMARRKFGLIIETITQRTINRTKMPSSFFMVELSFAAGSQMHHRLFAELFSFEETCDLAFMHDRDAIADPEHFFHLAADHHDRDTFSGKFANQSVNLRL